jgi:DNA repair exonuclease SbcCD ATPase subunit
MEQTPNKTPGADGHGGLSDLQVAREIEDIERLLTAARDFFQTAPLLREKIAAEQRSLEELSQKNRQQLTRNAAMAERAVAAEKVCGRHLEKAEEARRGIEARIGEASATLRVLEQAGGVEGLSKLRDEIHRVMERSKGWDEKVAASLLSAERLLGEVHDLLARLGGLDRLATALGRLDALEERTRRLEEAAVLPRLMRFLRAGPGGWHPTAGTVVAAVVVVILLAVLCIIPLSCLLR